MKYDVEPGFEIPKTKGRGPRTKFEYPFKEMNLLDSFFVPLTDKDFEKRLGRTTPMADSIKKRIRNQAAAYKRNVDKTFKIKIFERNQVQHHEIGLRVWRVEIKKKSKEDKATQS